MEDFGPELEDATVKKGFAERMKQIVRDYGGVRPFARELGYSVSAVQNWTNEIATPNVQRLRMIARLAGVRLEWLVTGEGERYDPRALPDDPRAATALFRPPLLSQVVFPPERQLPTIQAPELPYWPEVSSWSLMQRSVDPHSVALLAVPGEEMEPTLEIGDLVLVDTSDESQRSGIWCALDPDGHPCLLRLRWVPGEERPRFSQDKLGELDVQDAETAAGSLCGRVVTVWREEAI
ncbi:Phage repressor protein C, contains Cro/C1-type HTH and peptisase s24 domains [Thiohalospira halophila DSM 15071]|uniref:Phage repressor protein C, contains Cro/C1-type HTH and peptisase s24 domains n=1 Tax=Thiohalospira halophila DSM 15071 TaxID=1123397 RepID=A0A1I1N4A7_9GAMM|nr:helix-turn-helix domain-containing protein [Thiohalospira halophila]SFC90318.1 Phage repressor protein C, contains Cro/C1-type HTH and peptisase s24 domains [Thiohalospira halophila DSM 15071]